MAHHRGVRRAAGARACVRPPARDLRRAAHASAGTTWRRPPSRWRPGTCSPASRGRPLCEVLGGSPPRSRRASRPGCRSASRTRSTSLPSGWTSSSRAGYRRIKIKIKPGWDIEAVSHDPRALRRHPADGRRQRGLRPAATRRTSARLDRFDLMMIEQPLDYDDVRDHARAAGRIRTPICLDESIHTVRRGRGGASTSAPAGSSTSSRAGSAATRESIRLHDLAARARRFPSGTAACSRAASAARTTFTCRRCRTSRCPVTSRPAAAITRRT